MLISFANVLGLNKSHSVNFSRQRYEANGGPEVNLPTLKRSKRASGCSKSSTQGEGDRANLDEQSKTRQGICLRYIMRNCLLNLQIIITSPSNKLSTHHTKL